MSGPWDRSRPGDPDPEWPAEDLETRRAEDQARSPASEAPDSQAPDSVGRDTSPSSSWDDWPPTPPAEDYEFEDPLPPSSDLWSESWTDEGASRSPGAEATDRPAPVPEAPWMPPEPDPPAAPPQQAPWRPDSGPDWMAEPIDAPLPESSQSEPEPEPEPAAEPEPEPEPLPEAEPPSEREPEPAPIGEPEREAVDQPQLARYPAGESTQVFPTSWEPPPPSMREAELEPGIGPARTAFGADSEPDAVVAEGGRASMVEQAVPWLIGLILLLAGMVIVLLALIFSGDASLGGAAADPSGPSGVLPGSGEPSATATATSTSTATATQTPALPSRTAAPTIRPTPTPVPGPEYGALEVVYQGRSTAQAPIYLLLRDFTVEEDPTIMAQDLQLDVRRFAWAPDGTVGAALLADVLVSVEPGVAKRPLGDGIGTATFGDDASTVYAVGVAQDGTNDTATVLAIDFASGDSVELGSVTYVRPQIDAEPALQEAQFADEGGTVRLFWMEDDTLRLWVLGAGSWIVNPEASTIEEVSEELPLLWAPDGERRISNTETGTSTTLELLDAEGEVLATTTVDVLASHVRWSPDGQRVTFTGGELASGGGVLQDLYLWDPEEGTDPTRLTATGAAFGAVWLGTQPLWREAE